MAANGRGNMRPAGRSPPFLAIGLTVALVILGFNYWTLSARNGEQASEITLLESELRLVNAKKISAEKRSDAIQDKVKDFEVDIRKHKETLAKCQTDLANVNTRREDLEKQVADLQKDVEDANEQRMACTTDLAAKNEEVDTVKNAAKNCSESECGNYVRTGRSQERTDTLRDVYQVAGPQPLINMLDKGKDVSTLTTEIQTLKQQQTQNANQVPQGAQGAGGAGQFNQNQPGYNVGQEGSNQNPGYNAVGNNPEVPAAGNQQPIVQGNQQPIVHGNQEPGTNVNQDGQQGGNADQVKPVEHPDQSGKADSNARPGEEIPVIPAPNEHVQEGQDGQPHDLGHQDDDFTSKEGQAAAAPGGFTKPPKVNGVAGDDDVYNDADDAEDNEETDKNLKFPRNDQFVTQGDEDEDDYYDDNNEDEDGDEYEEGNDVQRNDETVDQMAMH